MKEEINLTKVKIILKKSIIGINKKNKNTIKSLGLKKINSFTIQKLTPDIQGKINKINYLVAIKKI